MTKKSDAREALQALYRIQKVQYHQTVFDDIRIVEDFLLRHPEFCSQEADKMRQKRFEAEKRLQETTIASTFASKAWPDVPSRKRVAIAKAFSLLPAAAGVYFAFQGKKGRCVYVGQTNCLCTRCSFKGKERLDGNLRSGDYLAWLVMPHEETWYAENFYIGLLKPERNLPRKFRRSRVN